MEKLSSDILRQLDLPCVEVELGYDEYTKMNGCLVTNFLYNSDQFIDQFPWHIVRGKNDEEELELCFEQMFLNYSQLPGISKDNVEKLKEQYIRLIFGKCLLENLDTKLENVGLIFNEQTREYRIPPSFDNGCSFKSYESISNPMCYVGNQLFEISKVITYILNNYLQYIQDILKRFDEFVMNDMLTIVDSFKGQIIEEKRQYIIKYLSTIHTMTKSYMQNKRK